MFWYSRVTVQNLQKTRVGIKCKVYNLTKTQFLKKNQNTVKSESISESEMGVKVRAGAKERKKRETYNEEGFRRKSASRTPGGRLDPGGG